MRVTDTATPSALLQRETTLAALANEQFDVLIVGGGVVCSGALLDAASRGLRVAVVAARGSADEEEHRATSKTKVT